MMPRLVMVFQITIHWGSIDIAVIQITDHFLISLESQMTEFAASLLSSPILMIVARAVLASFFLAAGIFGIFNFPAVVQEMTDASLSAPKLLAVATVATQLIGSVLLITNVLGLSWLGAIMLAVFTLLCIPFGHPFWQFEEPQRAQHLQIALEHFALSGGLVIAAIASLR
ncbi:DoxX family protein [Pseudomonas sp. Je.1.5.c]|uniref:DoxX family protein n=1 Tax=Pseudomonas sp. Je.1.5.c TaxID=3142839 RepID=UPI003DA8DB91